MFTIGMIDDDWTYPVLHHKWHKLATKLCSFLRIFQVETEKRITHKHFKKVTILSESAQCSRDTELLSRQPDIYSNVV